MEELDKALKHAKKQKSHRTDNLPVELFNSGANGLKEHTVALFSSTADKSQIPQDGKEE
jgi:hypothetical protein